MSNGRAFRRRRNRMSAAEVDTLTAISSAARGCICEPDIETRHTDWGTERRVHHDDWCPAANTGTAWGVSAGPHTTPEGFAKVVEALGRTVGES